MTYSIKLCDVNLMTSFLCLLFKDHWARGFEAGEYEFSGIHQQRTEESGPTGSLNDYKSQDPLLPRWFSGGQSDSEGKKTELSS